MTSIEDDSEACGARRDKPTGRITIGVAGEGAVRVGLYEALCWRDTPSRPPFEDLLAQAHNLRYIDGWGREGDYAVAAVDSAGTIGGGGWWRFFPAAEPGYGFVSGSIPEIGLGLRKGWRGQGIGSRLLAAVHDEARTRSIARLSLSVEPSNPAAHLYERFGYRKTGISLGAWTMVVQLLPETVASSS